MFTLNISFMAPRQLESRLNGWLRTLIHNICENPAFHDPRIVEVAEIPADPNYTEEALNISLQFDFPTLPEAREWAAEHMPVINGDIAAAFGENAVAFATILTERSKP